MHVNEDVLVRDVHLFILGYGLYLFPLHRGIVCCLWTPKLILHVRYWVSWSESHASDVNWDFSFVYVCHIPIFYFNDLHNNSQLLRMRYDTRPQISIPRISRVESPTARERRLQRTKESEQAHWAAETAAEKEEDWENVEREIRKGWLRTDVPGRNL